MTVKDELVPTVSATAMVTESWVVALCTKTCPKYVPAVNPAGFTPITRGEPANDALPVVPVEVNGISQFSPLEVEAVAV